MRDSGCNLLERTLEGPLDQFEAIDNMVCICVLMLWIYVAVTALALVLMPWLFALDVLRLVVWSVGV